MSQRPNRSQPVVLLASIFLCLLLTAPAVFAAQNFQNPRPGQNDIVFLNNTLSVFPGCCEVLIQKSCWNTSHQLIETNNQVLQYLGIDENLTSTYNEWLFTTTSLKSCDNGCSSTLNDCRLNTFWDNTAFILFVFITGCVVWFSRRLGPAGIVAIVAIMILSIVNLTWDVFAVNPILVQFFSIAIIVFGAAMALWPYHHEEED